MPIKISFSPLAEKQKSELCKKYPGLEQHIKRLLERIKNDPLLGTPEIDATLGKDIPVHTLSAATEIFSGNIIYHRALTVVYVCKSDLSIGRIIQILF